MSFLCWVLSDFVVGRVQDEAGGSPVQEDLEFSGVCVCV